MRLLDRRDNGTRHGSWGYRFFLDFQNTRTVRAGGFVLNTAVYGTRGYRGHAD